MIAMPGAWRCELHNLWTTGDCPECDGELIALTVAAHSCPCVTTEEHQEHCEGNDPLGNGMAQSAEPMHRWVEPHGDLTACGIRWWNGTRGPELVTCPACVTAEDAPLTDVPFIKAPMPERRDFPRDIAENDALTGLDGGLRGTVADAVTFARECSEEWGIPVVVRVEQRRATLPPIVARRADHDGPLWIIRPRPIPPESDDPS